MFHRCEWSAKETYLFYRQQLRSGKHYLQLAKSRKFACPSASCRQMNAVRLYSTGHVALKV